jgi:hypothetical protein
MERTNQTCHAGDARSIMTSDCSASDTCDVLYCYSMPALCGTAPALLRSRSRLGAGEQHGNHIFMPRIAHGHLCQLQVFRKWTPTNDC